MVWSTDSIKLSDRLQVMAEKVCEGETVADIGTDHGYLGLYLYEKGISPSVILTDISEASLSKAKASAGAGQFGNDVSFRVGDGLQVLDAGEVDCVVIAGMGGLLIREILAADPEKTRSYKRLVLQPRTAAGPLRKWLLESGFAILSEDIVFEGDFLPEIITAAPIEPDDEILDFDHFDYDQVQKLADGKIIDLAQGIRDSLVDGSANISSDTGEDVHPQEFPDDLPDENSIHFSVPIWILNASGPVLEYLDRRIGLQEDVLAGLKKAKVPDKSAIEAAEYSLGHMKQLRELKVLIEQHRAEEAQNLAEENERQK